MSSIKWRRVLAGGAALALTAGFAVASSSYAGLTDDVTGPGLVEDGTASVTAVTPLVITDLAENVADAVFQVDFEDIGLVPNLLGGSIVGEVPAELELVPEYTDCAVNGGTFTCTVTPADTSFQVYARTSTAGEHEVCAAYGANEIEALIEYDDNNRDCDTVTVIDDPNQFIGALEPGECATVDNNDASATTCNNATHPVIYGAEGINGADYTCNGVQCAATDGVKTAYFLVGEGSPFWSPGQNQSIVFTAPPRQAGQCTGQNCTALWYAEEAGSTTLERVPFCSTPEGSDAVVCIVSVSRVPVGPNPPGHFVYTYVLKGKIVEDPPLLESLLGGSSVSG